MVGSIYGCFYLSMLPNATECRAKIPSSKSHSRESQMNGLYVTMVRERVLFPRGRSASGTCLDNACVSQASLASSYNSSSCRLLRPLHLAHGYHLLPQVVLVLANATIPPSDCLVLTNQDIFRNLIEQSARMSAKVIYLVEVVVNLPEVVRDHDNTARKCIDGVS